MAIVGVLPSFLLVGFTVLAAYFYNLFWLKPERLLRKLRQQGINGPPPSFFFGNNPDIKKIQSETAKMKAAQGFDNRIMSHDYMSYLFPHLNKWKMEYGPQFAYSMGNMVIVCISDFDMARDYSRCKSIEFGRPSYLRKNRGSLLGNSIVTSVGTSWVHQRRIIAPEFNIDKVKGMADKMVQSAISMINRWEGEIGEKGGVASVRVDEDLKDFSAEIISKTCFGSNYVKGNEIFARIRALMDLLSKQYAFLGFPGFRYIPVKSNRVAWKLGREIKTSILELTEAQLTANKEDNFLDILVKNFCPNGGTISNMNIRPIADNCKAMFFAGHETTSTAAAFTLMLLAHHTEWQNRARDEIEEICAGQIPTIDMLHKMKTLTMVIYETLRLYPTTPFMTRETTEDMKFGKILFPKGVTIWLLVTTLHQDPAIWGADAGEFNPERFANGISRACKLPHLYMPFGSGLRSCLGQTYAMVELKILLSLMLSKFTFSLSPEYSHSTAFRLVTQPEYGVHLLMRKI